MTVNRLATVCRCDQFEKLVEALLPIASGFSLGA
jgi:hypothetical protein